jgi:UDP-N-acetylglucosamine 4-epimerase
LTLAALRATPRTWLVTGAAGFIGSNLVEALLLADQHVVGLDNFATGSRQTLAEVREAVGEPAWRRFRLVEGDVTALATCRAACEGVDLVLHHAALASVPRSIADPVGSHRTNVDGHLNMLVAAKEAAVERFVFASSSAVYGDDEGLPKVEARTGEPLSPYAAHKAMDEVYARLFARTYGLTTIGLRYFNVYGRRQDPDGPYAAVIPRWIATMLAGERCTIHGDGETTRDFCHVSDVVQANILAGLAEAPDALNTVYNVACGTSTSLTALYQAVRDTLALTMPEVRDMAPLHTEFRAGDIRHSLADIRKAVTLLGYAPRLDLVAGLAEAMPWYVAHAEGA